MLSEDGKMASGGREGRKSLTHSSRAVFCNDFN